MLLFFRTGVFQGPILLGHMVFEFPSNSHLLLEVFFNVTLLFIFHFASKMIYRDDFKTQPPVDRGLRPVSVVTMTTAQNWMEPLVDLWLGFEVAPLHVLVTESQFCALDLVF